MFFQGRREPGRVFKHRQVAEVHKLCQFCMGLGPFFAFVIERHRSFGRYGLVGHAYAAEHRRGDADNASGILPQRFRINRKTAHRIGCLAVGAGKVLNNDIAVLLPYILCRRPF